MPPVWAQASSSMWLQARWPCSAVSPPSAPLAGPLCLEAQKRAGLWDCGGLGLDLGPVRARGTCPCRGSGCPRAGPAVGVWGGSDPRQGEGRGWLGTFWLGLHSCGGALPSSPTEPRARSCIHAAQPALPAALGPAPGRHRPRPRSMTQPQLKRGLAWRKAPCLCVHAGKERCFQSLQSTGLPRRASSPSGDSEGAVSRPAAGRPVPVPHEPCREQGRPRCGEAAGTGPPSHHGTSTGRGGSSSAGQIQVGGGGGAVPCRSRAGNTGLGHRGWALPGHKIGGQPRGLGGHAPFGLGAGKNLASFSGLFGGRLGSARGGRARLAAPHRQECGAAGRARPGCPCRHGKGSPWWARLAVVGSQALRARPFTHRVLPRELSPCLAQVAGQQGWLLAGCCRGVRDTRGAAARAPR